MSRASGYRTVSTAGQCVWSDVAGSDAPILTDDQVAAAIGSLVHFAGKSPSVPNPEGPPVVGCEWTESTDPAVSVAVDEQDFPSPPDAAAQYQSQLTQALTMVDANLTVTKPSSPSSTAAPACTSSSATGSCRWTLDGTSPPRTGSVR